MRGERPKAMPRAGLVLALVLVASTLATAAPVRAAGKANVAALQIALRVKGLYRAPVDGVLGPQTKRGVRRLQRRAGLRVDGVVGPRTRRALGRLGRPPLGSRHLRRGLVGWDVSMLQFELARHGFAGGSLDGAFGDGTRAAVRGFQRFARLRVDGVVGPATLAALRGSAASSPGDSLGQRAVRIAKRYLGVPYVWGGENPKTGFDCSGLVVYVYRQLGIELPHFSGSQWRLGTRIARAELEPGDLVFFEQRARGPHHVGIYIGDGWLIEAPHTGDVVRISTVKEKARVLGYVGAVRPY